MSSFIPLLEFLIPHDLEIFTPYLLILEFVSIHLSFGPKSCLHRSAKTSERQTIVAPAGATSVLGAPALFILIIQLTAHLFHGAPVRSAHRSYRNHNSIGVPYYRSARMALRVHSERHRKISFVYSSGHYACAYTHIIYNYMHHIDYNN